MQSPHPGKQTEFIKSIYDVIFFGGARGPGKSWGLAYKAAYTLTDWHYEVNGQTVSKKIYEKAKESKREIVPDKLVIDYPDYVALLVRRTNPSLVKNLKPECDKLYFQYGAKWNELRKTYTFPSGAKVMLAHCMDKKALNNYIGGNYNFIGIDEANQFPEEWIEMLSGSLRTDNPKLRPQMCLTSNPGNVGHLWLKKKFVDKAKPIKIGEKHSKEFNVTYNVYKTAPPFIDDNGVSYQYIPATVFDNPSILKNDKKYVFRLMNLNETLRKMWLSGDWDAAQGMFFDNWDIFHHTIPQQDFKFGTEKFNLSTHYLYRAYDYGVKAPFVCLFIAMDRDGNAIVFDEIVRKEMAASAQAKLVNKYSFDKYGLLPDDFMDNIADPAYWGRQSEKDGVPYSYASFYADEGIYLTKGFNDRKAGAGIVYNALDMEGKDVAMVRFVDNCEYCIETFPTLPTKPNDPEDVDTKSEDHGFDAFKYFATRMLAVPTIKLEPKKKGWRDRMKEKATYMGYSSNQGSWRSL